MKALLIAGAILFMLGIAISEVIDAYGQIQTQHHEELAKY